MKSINNTKIDLAYKADMIIEGIAFYLEGSYILVIDLNQNNKSLRFKKDSKQILESTMTLDEEKKVFEIWDYDKEFLEVSNA